MKLINKRVDLFIVYKICLVVLKSVSSNCT